jgi:hypothetical protein
MSVTQDETALSRGRIPAHLRRRFQQILCMFLNARGRRLQLNACLSLVSPRLLIFIVLYCCQKSVLYSLFAALYHHYSFDMFIRPTILFNEGPMEDPVYELPSPEFYELSGFWPNQFREIVDNLHLIPGRITCSVTRCATSRDVAVFMMLRWWRKADKWEDVSHVVRRGRVWGIKIYKELFSLLAQHYRRLVQVLDYRRIILLLEEWSDSMVMYTGCCRDVLFFTDGKPWKMAKPGTGDAAAALERAAGGDQVNQVQQAFYNDHYGFAGAKIQHVLQADGLCYSFTCPLCRHDAIVHV